jgi:hypothetical protein
MPFSGIDILIVAGVIVGGWYVSSVPGYFSSRQVAKHMKTSELREMIQNSSLYEKIFFPEYSLAYGRELRGRL